MSHSASWFLSTIAQLHENEMEPLRKSDASTVTTVSAKTSRGSSSRNSNPQKHRKDSHFKRINQINLVPALTFESPNDCLHSIEDNEDDHTADLALQ